MSGRWDIYHDLQTLDPVTQHQEMVYLVGSYEYPWLVRKSLEFALFRTYAVPEISQILAASGQFEHHGQKRYDDTTLMLAGIAEQGYESDYGRKAIARMNVLHGRWAIKNEDFLYVLSTFIYEPTRWHRKYGWRKPTQKESLANYYFWKAVGQRMGIENIPDDYHEYERFNIEYEASRFAYSDTNELIGKSTVQVFLKWYPKWLRPLVRRGLYAMMDDRLLQAFGFPKQHVVLRTTVHGGLWLLGRVVRFMPPRTRPYRFTDQPNRSYPDGYDVEKLGPAGQG